MNISDRQSLLAAAAYADVFDYPLSRDEAILWRVGRAGKAGISHVVLPRHRRLIQLRQDRAVLARAKWRIARRAGAILRRIPGILLVGVTGGLAMDNAAQEDDIDFLCLTARGTLWTSRLFAILLLDGLGLRRRPREARVTNRICLNMFMEEGSFSVPSGERDLFAAHEVLQMVPLWQRGNSYQRFLKANAWVKKFLPNAWREKCQMINDTWPMNKEKNLEFRFLEQPAKALQLWYMRKHRTTEVITRGILRFHPKDARIWVRAEFSSRLQALEIPLDKIFSHR